MEVYPNFEHLRRISRATVRFGRKEDDGYSFVQSKNFSYQGVSASYAASIVKRCTTKLDCQASFEFEWHNKAGLKA